MAQFDLAYNITKGNEGGYSNNPNDHGGRTYRGISEKNFPDWEGWKIIDQYEPIKEGYVIKNPVLDKMIYDFYQRVFWEPNHLSDISNQVLTNEIYDAGVNFGVGTAAIMLQKSLNLLNNNGKKFADLKVDGVIGWMTTQAVNSFQRQMDLMKTFNGERFCRYKEICEKDPSQEVFFQSWLNRINFENK